MNHSLDEMFLISKYKYITRFGQNSFKNVVLHTLSSSMSSTKTDEELKKEQRELQLKEKKEKMQAACKQKEKNLIKKGFKEKEKVVNPTPEGEKKGK